MRKLFILLALMATCKDWAEPTWLFATIRKCETEESVCYQTTTRDALSCYPKESK